MDDLAENLSLRLTLSGGNSPPSSVASPGGHSRHSTPSSEASPGRYSVHPLPKLKIITQTIKEIKKAITTKDNTPGFVYVAKAITLDNDTPGSVNAANSVSAGYTKVGYTKKNDKTRVKEIGMKCGVDFEKFYWTVSFDCAYRAEQTVHRLLYDWAHYRLDCKCRQKNHEWYQMDFCLIEHSVRLVYAWMTQTPYDKVTKKLKPEWERALGIWSGSQYSEAPLPWDEFFLNGLSLRPVPKAPFQVSAIPGVRPRLLFGAKSSPAALNDTPLKSATSAQRHPSTVRAETTPSKILHGMTPNASFLTTPARPIPPTGSPKSESKTITEPVVAEDPGKAGSSNKERRFLGDHEETSEEDSMTEEGSIEGSITEVSEGSLEDGESEDDGDPDYQPPPSSDEEESAGDEELTEEDLARDQEKVGYELADLGTEVDYFANEEELVRLGSALSLEQVDLADEGEFSSEEDGPAEDGPAEDGPAEDGPAEDGPAEVGPAEDGPAEDGPAEVGPAEVGPAEVEPAEDEPAEVELTKHEPAEGRAQKAMTQKHYTFNAEPNTETQPLAQEKPLIYLFGQASKEISMTESAGSYWGSKNIMVEPTRVKDAEYAFKGSFLGLDVTVSASMALPERTKAARKIVFKLPD